MAGILERIINPGIQAGRPGPDDDFWYGPIGNPSSSGVQVTPSSALTISAVWACVRLISQTIGSLPCILYRWIDAENRERAREDPLYRLLNFQPNEYQTRFHFWQMMMGHALLRGNAYAELYWNARGELEEMVPLFPGAMRVERLPNRRLRYTYKPEWEGETVYSQDEIFHLKGLSTNGMTGLSVVEQARESFGLTLAAEEYGARFFAQGAEPGGILTHPGKIGSEAARRVEQSWQRARSGLKAAHKVALLEEGMKWERIGMSNEDAQFLLTREFQKEEVATWFNVPLHMISSTTKATSWGSGLEQLSLGFVIYTLGPWLVNSELELRRSLVTDEGQFIEFLFDALLRGNIKDRYEAYAKGINWGWFNRNEVRRMENLNPAPGLDEFLQPVNMAPAGWMPQQGQSSAAEASISPPGPPERDPRMLALAITVAGRLVRKEITAISKFARKSQANFEEAVTNFYSSHAELVAQEINISLEEARQYCDTGREALLWQGVKAMENWEDIRVQELASLSLDRGDNDGHN